jgi:class 3 adenylate cyclase
LFIGYAGRIKSEAMTSTLPSGTVTFLFTDIEGSMKLAQAHPAAWEGLRAQHDSLLRSAIESNHGVVFQVMATHFARRSTTPRMGSLPRSTHSARCTEWPTAAVQPRLSLAYGWACTPAQRRCATVLIKGI